MCEVTARGGQAHPGMADWLAALAAREAEGAIDGSVMELREALGCTGEVGGVGGEKAGSVVVGPWVVESPRGQRALVLHRHFLLDQISQGFAGHVERVEAQVIVLLLGR